VQGGGYASSGVCRHAHRREADAAGVERSRTSRELRSIGSQPGDLVAGRPQPKGRLGQVTDDQAKSRRLGFLTARSPGRWNRDDGPDGIMDRADIRDDALA
jgi:hypothetical protein